MSSYLDKMLSAYLGCALWASNDNADKQGGEPLDENYSASDFPAEELDKARAVCSAFMDAHWDALTSADAGPEQWGHDLFLTRNGHGAGFWDRQDEQYTKEARDALTAAAHALGESQPYIGDDGRLFWA